MLRRKLYLYRKNFGYSIIDVLWIMLFAAIIAGVLKFFAHQYDPKKIFAGIVVGIIIAVLLIGYFHRIVRFISKKTRDVEKR